MKNQRDIRHCGIGLAVAIMSATASAANAAAVTWASAFEIASDGDISLAGRQVVYAVNAGDNVGNTSILDSAASGSTLNVVIGGQTVAFQGVSVLYGTGSTFGASSYGDLAGQIRLTANAALPRLRPILTTSWPAIPV